MKGETTQPPLLLRGSSVERDHRDRFDLLHLHALTDSNKLQTDSNWFWSAIAHTEDEQICKLIQALWRTHGRWTDFANWFKFAHAEDELIANWFWKCDCARKMNWMQTDSKVNCRAISVRSKIETQSEHYTKAPKCFLQRRRTDRVRRSRSPRQAIKNIILHRSAPKNHHHRYGVPNCKRT